jgi:hypothetical protein
MSANLSQEEPSVSVIEIPPAGSDVDSAPRDVIQAPPTAELDLYRKRLETDGWSDDTIHPSYLETRRPDVAPSHGQCGVSSAWLLEKLQVEQRIRGTYCYGDVLSAVDGSPILPRHCWIEIGDPEALNRLVIDVTWDQVEGLVRESVLCEPHDDLLKQEAVNYAASMRSSFAELRNDLVWDRFVNLKQALGEVVEDLPARA